MTSFSFSTGNPANLTGGANASMTDIGGSFTDLRTFLNGGNITDTNVTGGGLTDASLASPTSPVWRTIIGGEGWIQGLTTTPAMFAASAIQPSGISGNAPPRGLWVPTASDLAVAGKTTRLRLRVAWLTNATAPGINITWGLYPAGPIAGGVGAITITLGTVVAGSTATVSAPAANSGSVATGASFDISAVTGGNPYILGVVGSGSQAANSVVACEPFLEMRHT